MMTATSTRRWWPDSVVYHIYPRSFQDTNDDGVGDLRGIVSRLEYIADLGVDAIWLSPIHPSPMADFGYDVQDYESIEPQLGALADFDELVSAAHERNLRVVMDLVAGHTSVQHPWFREHPDRYIWADGRSGGLPPNNWESIFGGPAWSKDPRTGRWYMHSFFAEQPDLNWHNPDLVHAIQEVVRFWRNHGVDGFRIDSVDTLVKDNELRDDPPATAPFGLPLRHAHGNNDLRYSRSATGTQRAMAALREAAGEAFLVGEVYLPMARWAPYLASLDCIFAFEVFHAEPDASTLRAALEHSLAACAGARAEAGWVVSNHDFPRMPTRVGRLRERVYALMALTLPGPVFIYQGDEIGLGDGPGAEPSLDPAGRDRHRHPMQWNGSATGAFTKGTPWLGLVDPATRNVYEQSLEADSTLAFYRRAIAVRRLLKGPIRLVESPEGVLAFDRDRHRILLNFSDHASDISLAGEIVCATHTDVAREGELSAFGGVVTRLASVGEPMGPSQR
jgi:alpha-glucosidase